MSLRKELSILLASGYIWIGFSFFTEGQTELIVCPFRLITGIPCPGCGLTRGIMAILHGNLHDALALHILSFPAVVALTILPIVLCYDFVFHSNVTQKIFDKINFILSKLYISIPFCIIAFADWLRKLIL